MTKLIKKVVQKLIGVGIWTPVTLTFFHDKSELKVACFFLIFITSLFQALVGGDGITLQKIDQIMTNLNP
jgi:hypothetical protein